MLSTKSQYVPVSSNVVGQVGGTVNGSGVTVFRCSDNGRSKSRPVAQNATRTGQAEEVTIRRDGQPLSVLISDVDNPLIPLVSTMVQSSLYLGAGLQENNLKIGNCEPS